MVHGVRTCKHVPQAASSNCLCHSHWLRMAIAGTLSSKQVKTQCKSEWLQLQSASLAQRLCLYAVHTQEYVAIDVQQAALQVPVLAKAVHEAGQVRLAQDTHASPVLGGIAPSQDLRTHITLLLGSSLVTVDVCA